MRSRHVASHTWALLLNTFRQMRVTIELGTDLAKAAGDGFGMAAIAAEKEEKKSP